MKHLAWVALLPGGILLLMLARPLYQHRYDDQGFGIFYGDFRGSYIPLDGSNGSVVISGETIPEWRWARPTNYKYPIIKFGTIGFRVGKSI